jgi:hypothetical protein
MPHPLNCPCAICEGLRLYPEPSLCSWCNKVHAGNAANCYDPEADERAKLFSGDTAEIEQLTWDVHNQLKAITKYVKEQQMIPDPQVPEQQANRGRGTNSARTGFPYLNQANQAEYFTTDSSVKVKILDCRVVSKPVGNQSPITLKLAIRGRVILWGLRITNQNLPILIQMFGKDENDWADKEIMMSLQIDEFTGKIWPHVEPAEETKKGKK